MGCKSSKNAKNDTKQVEEPVNDTRQVEEPVKQEPVKEPVPEKAPEPVEEPKKEAPAPLKAMGGLLSGAMSGAAKVVLEKTISSTEEKADALAPTCVKPLYCCCGGPVGTMSLMGCCIAADQRDNFYKGVESYYQAKVELAKLNNEGCCCCCCCPC